MQHYSREKKGLKILNLVFYILMIVVNVLANIKIFGQTTVLEVLEKYNNVFTPHSITFFVWILVYIMLGYFVLYQLEKSGYGAKKEAVERIGSWFIVSCILNMLWLFFLTFDMIKLSMIIMLTLLLVIYVIYFRVHTVQEYLYNDEKKGLIRPFSLYAGWISAITLVNFAALVKYMGLNLLNVGENLWGAVAIVVLTIVNLCFLYFGKDKAFAFTGILTLAGIVYARYLAGNIMPVGYVAIVAIFILVVVMINSRGRKA